MWLARERSTSWLPGFDAAWLPDEARDRITAVVSSSNVVGLEIDAWVGSVPLRNGETLRITSKFGDVNFIRMLMRALGIQIDIGATTEYATSEEESPLRFVIPTFLKSLRTIESNGLHFKWASRSVVSRARPTQVRVAATARRVALGKKDPFVGRQVERTMETPEHRVIALASAVVLRERAGQSMDETDLLLLKMWRRRGWDRSRLNADLIHVRRALRAGHYSGSRGYYSDAMRLALMLLGAYGISTIGDSQLRAESFLVNSDRLFEEYVRSILFETLRDDGFVVEKEAPGSAPLFVDGTATMEPDILVLQGARVAGLGDVKHKHPDASDYYQMFTYLRQYGLSMGFIVTASENAGALTRHRYRRDGVELVILPVPIDDLDTTETLIGSIRSHVQF